MLDGFARRIIDPPLIKMARYVPCSATQMTLIGFAIGLGCVAATAYGQYDLALILLWINRLCDGLDGAIARHRKQESDLGAYLDITSDFILWALLPLAFIWEHPEAAWAGALLLSSFAMSMTTFLAFATMAEKRGLSTEKQGKKSFFYLDGLAEGTETILFFSACFLWSTAFTQLAMIFATIVFLSVLGRIISSWHILSQ